MPIHWGTLRLSWEGYATPPRLLAAMMRCGGGDPARFAGIAIGRPFDVPEVAVRGPVPDLAAIDRCERNGVFAPLH